MVYTYIQPNDVSSSAYARAIYDLYDQGYRFIVCPGYLFEDAVLEVQNNCTDLQLVLLDASLGNSVGANTVAVSYNELEAGYIAGLATALELIEGSVGFVGAIEIPIIQKYSWGFQQGVEFANENIGTMIEMDPSNFVYSGSFADLALGGYLASAMFDRGVDVIFAPAGGTGIGFINEALIRKRSGENVWVVGYDVDQYSEGDMGKGRSCILTSAVKRFDKTVYDLVYAAYNSEFPGGKNIMHSSGYVGIPKANPNLSAETMMIVAEVEYMIRSGDIVIQSNPTGLIP